MPIPIPRRAAFGLLGGAMAAPPSRGVAAEAAEWSSFKSRFLTPEGRVVDTGNGGQSHSEGQGWGLMMAEHFADREAFEAMLAWTRRNLRRDTDRLHAWRWLPDRAVAVPDSNNATDGDLFIAAALLRAGRRWEEPGLVEDGAAVARDVLRLLVRRVGTRVLLLPGVRGFDHPGHVVLNPSYYCFPAIAVLAQAVPDPAWLRLASDGIRLLRTARFGRWGLSPDWLAVSRQDGRMTPAQGWPARFSYDAVRVPLWMAWAGLADEPAAGGALGFWSDPAMAEMPAWTDLNDDSVAPYAAGAGARDIAMFVAAERRAHWRREAAEGSTPNRDYYDTALALLVRIGASERLRRL